MIYGYARVSTKGQKDGISLEAQERALLERGCDKVLRGLYWNNYG